MKAKTNKKYNLNLFEILDAIQSKNRRYYGSLNDDQKREVVPLILMRWLTGSNNKNKIDKLNSIANLLVPGPGVSRRYIKQDHGALLYNLLVCCMDGRRERNGWLKKNSSAEQAPLAISIIKTYFEYGTREARDALKVLSKEDIIKMAEQLGQQKNEISALTKELKT